MKPILFSTPMVQAILDGRKTMTRRVVKPQPCPEATRFEKFIHTEDCGWEARFGNSVSSAVCDRKLQIDTGDILWVRETWCDFGGNYWYKANAKDCDPYASMKWRPSIFMPREAARLFLRVTDVRVERVQDISEDDAKHEGIGMPLFTSAEVEDNGYVDCFASLWDSINFKRGYGWDKNPWVWVVTFERCKKPEGV